MTPRDIKFLDVHFSVWQFIRKIYFTINEFWTIMSPAAKVVKTAGVIRYFLQDNERAESGMEQRLICHSGQVNWRDFRSTAAERRSQRFPRLHIYTEAHWITYREILRFAFNSRGCRGTATCRKINFYTYQIKYFISIFCCGGKCKHNKFKITIILFYTEYKYAFGMFEEICGGKSL